MKKILVIENCTKCDYYFGNTGFCSKLQRSIIVYKDKYMVACPIPDDCPLPTYTTFEEDIIRHKEKLDKMNIIQKDIFLKSWENRLKIYD